MIYLFSRWWCSSPQTVYQRAIAPSHIAPRAWKPLKIIAKFVEVRRVILRHEQLAQLAPCEIAWETRNLWEVLNEKLKTHGFSRKKLALVVSPAAPILILLQMQLHAKSNRGLRINHAQRFHIVDANQNINANWHHGALLRFAKLVKKNCVTEHMRWLSAAKEPSGTWPGTQSGKWPGS